MKATAIVPVKRFSAAKQRLGLSEQDRIELVGAMLEDVLEAIGQARMIERSIVVSGEPAATSLAAAAGAELVEDPADAGHSEAAQIGVRRAGELGVSCVALLPGDCPLLDPRELDRLLTGVPDRYAAVVPDRHGSGTNSLVLAPPDAIAPAFGPDSCERHIEAARKAGLPFSVERLESLALDLDTPADIIALTRELHSGRAGAARTAKVLGI